MNRICGRWVVTFLVGLGSVLQAQTREDLVQIYVVRHPETESAPADLKAIHLSDIGRRRAALLVPTFADILVSHLFASHTVRARETLEGLARERSLSIVQLPTPGSSRNGQVVNDQMSRREAIEPIADALRALAPGSVAVVGLNSESIFAVLNRLGVPVAASGQNCAVGQLCVPCLNNTCFPPAFDRLWYLAIRPGTPEPIVFLQLRYGSGWPASQP